MALSSGIDRKFAWKGRVAHVAQLGGIETAVLDNGPGRNTRIAWFDTGTGFRFKVVPDRGLDIVDAFFNSHSLAWISHGGITAPEPFSDHGITWLRSFAGGLMTTCGITHAGVPDADEFGERGLHGPFSNTPAEIVSVVQPDLVKGNMQMQISGIIKESSALGHKLEMRRTISGELGRSVIRVHDEVINAGNQDAPHMLLYHLNFGWPLVDEGAEILWKGSWNARDASSERIFNNEHPFHQCQPPLSEHAGSGEAACYIDAAADKEGTVTCGIFNPRIGIAFSVRYKKSQMPCLTNWQHWGYGEYVTGLEPATNFPIGQKEARATGKLIFLSPGESRNYEMEFELIHDQKTIKDFRNSFN